ncbi:MAG: ROK family protein [Kiritimatiellae bacterium]|nr:ROK family protein [Kiritimatiellia bacterium]
MSSKCKCGCGAAEQDTGFQSPLKAVNFLRAHAHGKGQVVSVAWEREGGNVYRYDLEIPRRIDPVAMPGVAHLVERIVKFVLWSAGGWKLYLSGPDEIVKPIAKAYTKKGARAFDYGFFNDLYGRPIEVEILPLRKMPVTKEREVLVKNNVNGNRIGFDLGASDFKISALKRGKVVFSKEFPWDPRPQSDPDYHYEKLSAGLEEAAAALGGKVDAIGGSSAGTFVGKKLGVASLIRGVKEKNPSKYEIAQNLFARVEDEWQCPFEVFNDGDVTALAGAITMKRTGILGVAMGSSEAVGYINQKGALTGRISELAFAPVDLNPNSGMCEWSRDFGVGAMYFSQQAVDFLARRYGMKFPKTMKLPERLKVVQAAMEKHEEIALKIYLMIGRYLANAAAWYREFYDYSNLMILGRVTSGFGGDVILNTARMGLEALDPALAEQIDIFMPDEKARRLGQSVAAAQIPELK